MSTKQGRKGKRVRHYSRGGSKWFWDRVHKIPWSQGGEAVYSLGCALQDLEARVMTQLENCEVQRSSSPGQPAKGDTK